jgi:hypothetical protein
LPIPGAALFGDCIAEDGFAPVADTVLLVDCIAEEDGIVALINVVTPFTVIELFAPFLLISTVVTDPVGLVMIIRSSVLEMFCSVICVPPTSRPSGMGIILGKELVTAELEGVIAALMGTVKAANATRKIIMLA